MKCLPKSVCQAIPAYQNSALSPFNGRPSSTQAIHQPHNVKSYSLNLVVNSCFTSLYTTPLHPAIPQSRSPTPVTPSETTEFLDIVTKMKPSCLLSQEASSLPLPSSPPSGVSLPTHHFNYSNESWMPMPSKCTPIAEGGFMAISRPGFISAEEYTLIRRSSLVHNFNHIAPHRAILPRPIFSRG